MSNISYGLSILVCSARLSLVRLINTLLIFRTNTKAGTRPAMAHAACRRAGAATPRIKPANLWAGLILFTLILPVTASATIGSVADAPGLMQSSCPSGAAARDELGQFKNKIAAAETIIQAKEMAIAPADMALEALRNANAILPFSDDLRIAETRLSEARSRMLRASSQEQVADAFSGMMLAGLDDNSAARVNVGNESCNYSTGEVIAIVIGLILGIIPGLILLVVLC